MRKQICRKIPLVMQISPYAERGSGGKLVAARIAVDWSADNVGLPGAEKRGDK